MPLAQPPSAAERQAGLFTVEQARQEGASLGRVRRMLRSGRWVRVVGDVLVVAGTQQTTRLRMRAAVLATGGTLSHSSAAGLWNLPVRAGEQHELHVTLPVPSHPSVPGVRVHRRPLHEGEKSWLFGMAVTSRRRTVIDCLLTWPESSAAELIDHLLRTRCFTVASLQGLADDAVGQHGVRRMRSLVDAALAGSWSAAERCLHQVLRRARITGWVANHRLALPGGGVAVADVWFPDHLVAVEVDGQAWHSSSSQFQADRSRQNRLVLAGATVLRFTWTDLTQTPDLVVAQVRAALSAKPTVG